MEKKGNTVKLEYDFNSSANLEVFLPNLKNWYRVTSREFRSFNTARRLNGAEYNGPLYLFGTNKKVPLTLSGKLVGYDYVEKRGKHRL